MGNETRREGSEGVRGGDGGEERDRRECASVGRNGVRRATRGLGEREQVGVHATLVTVLRRRKVASAENEVSAQGDGERAMNLTGDLRLVDVDDAHAHVRAVLGNDGHGGAADVASAHAADLQTCRGGTI